jgi:methionyl-tRNA formyltransferase
MDKKDFRIVFMGTPDFAVESLNILVKNDFNVVCVITSPDKPSGRGQKINQSAVKKFAIDNDLPILQPTNLKDTDFQNKLKTYNADLNVVVAFRMLPESVWNMPRLGSINLHGSLLPDYRGAAPINWAIINGETKTGVTTFFLKHEIDTGNIIFQEETDIAPDDNAEIIHDKLMAIGAKLILKTIQAVIDNNYKEIPQKLSENKKPKIAPKIFKNDCIVDWSQPINKIHNHIRGLSPYPTAWSVLKSDEKEINFKIFQSQIEVTKHNHKTGTIITDNKNYIKIAVNDGFVSILELQLSGKKRMSATDFLRGFKQLQLFTVA